MKKIFLVGFMGTGKTTVGKELAKMLGVRFLDLDDYIESKSGKKITDIFKENGEKFFRKLEKDSLKEVAQSCDFTVIACGGGIVLDPDNIAIMEENGIPVCLHASPDLIYERVKGQAFRPLLNVPDPKAKILELLNKRAPFYAKIKTRIEDKGFSAEQMALKIKQVLGL